MSNNDKAKNKLMESMRMTKEGSDKKVEEVNTQQDLKPQEDKPAKQDKKKPAVKKAVKVAANTQDKTTTSFQAAQRVWPD